MSATRKCPECGTPLPENSSFGGCPACALRDALEAAVTEKPGDQIDRYKLLEKIGEGGCGVVYLAEQTEPIRREVALKVIKLGMDTRNVIARFEAERQVLALMDHPNIARVFDAGATDTGRPYFVMELVHGVRVTDHCDQNQLTTRERLELFQQVCQAVQHAHQKGIIHRDLKPSNILVTTHDNVAGVKVIDFGIAKATAEQSLNDQTRFTAAHQFLGTPAYMSPEQAGMNGLDIDTRSDIYSLGVLLYELLTSHLPFDKEELLKAGFDEMRRVIREEEPPKPSTRLGTMMAGELNTVAKRQQTEAPRLVKRIRGDLDWIVMKSLEKERARRYETAVGLAQDVGRYLQGEAVSVGPPGVGYRMGKFVRRHRYGLATAAAIVLLLLGGVVVSTWQAVRATRAEHQAEAVAGFLKKMLNGVRPSRALGRDTQMLREILDQTAANLGRDLTNQPAIEAELRATLGGVYLDLGRFKEAEAMQRAALAQRKTIFGDQHPTVADSLDDLGRALYFQSRLAEAEPLQRNALTLRKKLYGNRHEKVAGSLNNLANTLREEGKIDEAETMFREALTLRRTLLGGDHVDTAMSLDNLGGVLSLENKLQEAEPLQREALALTRRLVGDVHPDVATSLNNLADTLMAEGKLTEAEPLLREALAMRKKLFGPEHPNVAFSIFALANLMLREEKFAEAEKLHRAALAMRRILLGDSHTQVADSLNNLTVVLLNEGRLEEAEQAQREALDIQRKALGAEHQDIAGSLANLADILRRRGRLAEAETFQRDALAMQRKLFGEDSPDVAASFAGLAAVLQEQGKLAGAEDLLRQEFALRQKWFAKSSPPLPALRDNLVDNYARLVHIFVLEKKFAEAEPLAVAWLSIGEQELPDDCQTFNAKSLLGAVRLGLGKPAEAEPLLLAGAEGMSRRQDKMTPDYFPRLKENLEWLVRLYETTGQQDKGAEWRKRLADYRPPGENTTGPKQ